MAWGSVFFPQSLIFDEVDLSDASVAETSTKNINNSFTVREVWGSPPCPSTSAPHGEPPQTPRPTEPWGIPRRGPVLPEGALGVVCRGFLGAGWPQGGLARGQRDGGSCR